MVSSEGVVGINGVMDSLMSLRSAFTISSPIVSACNHFSPAPAKSINWKLRTFASSKVVFYFIVQFKVLFC